MVAASVDQCWAFFSNPGNLRKITPPELDFRILGELPERVYPGLMLQYRVRPLLGIPMTWLTEITHVEDGVYFVDEQRVGPYKLWHHEHRFESLSDGTTVVHDRVHYVLPLGVIGALFHPLLVAPQLRRIFEHRTAAINERFPTAPMVAA